MTRTVGILIYPDIEVLDFSGPFEVFSTASRVFLCEEPEGSAPFRLEILAEALEPVLARGGLKILPDASMAQTAQLDVLIVPGGGVASELSNPSLLEWLRTIHAHTEITASVCTGSFLLAQAGLLEGLMATTHWEDIQKFAERYSAVQVVADQRWIEQGKVVTSAGISAGIDMSLHLVARVESAALAERTARQMDYRWQRDGPESPYERH